MILFLIGIWLAIYCSNFVRCNGTGVYGFLYSCDGVNGLDGITFDELGLIKVCLLLISDSGQLCLKLGSISIVYLRSVVYFGTTVNLLIGTFLVLKIYLSLSAYYLL